MLTITMADKLVVGVFLFIVLVIPGCIRLTNHAATRYECIREQEYSTARLCDRLYHTNSAANSCYQRRIDNDIKTYC